MTTRLHVGGFRSCYPALHAYTGSSGTLPKTTLSEKLFGTLLARAVRVFLVCAARIIQAVIRVGTGGLESLTSWQRNKPHPEHHLAIVRIDVDRSHEAQLSVTADPKDS